MAIGESRREVRITWIGFAVIFTVIGSIVLYKDRGFYIYFYSAALFFGIFAAAAPMALLPLYRLWVRFAMAMAWFNTRLLLGLVFYFVITPTGIFLRLVGKDPLVKNFDREAATYWERKEKNTDLSRYEKQY